LSDPRVDVNAPDISAETPLHSAVSSSSFVQVLLKHPGIDPNKHNNQGKTPVQLAIDQDNQTIACTLFAHDKMTYDTRLYGFSYAILHKKYEIAQALLQTINSQEREIFIGQVIDLVERKAALEPQLQYFIQFDLDLAEKEVNLETQLWFFIQNFNSNM
jgi:hypothetical protein